jgi:protein-S-isoprenylcysteine O-methyltransferase Ste14
MESLRLILVAGLVAHKVVWELMKTRSGRASTVPAPTPSRLKRLVKYGKTAVLIFLVIQTLFLDILPIGEQAMPLRLAGLLIYGLGLAVAITGRLQLGQNWSNLEDYRVRPGQALVSHGIYRYIRHPIYAGDLMLLIGLELALNSWLVLGVIVPLVTVLRQAAREESLLARTFVGYTDYQRRTKRFIPFLL